MHQIDDEPALHGFVLGSDMEEIWSRADGERRRMKEVPKVDMALVSIDDS